MQIVLHLLLIIQNLQIVQLHHHERRFVRIIKRDVHSSSFQSLNRFVKTYEIDQNIVLNTPNFTLIDSLLSTISRNRSKSSVREHSRWFMRSIFIHQYKEIARYDSNHKRFILHSHANHSYSVHPITGELTLVNNNKNNLEFLQTEISIHAESGLSKGDDILHDIYRFIRISTRSINCTTNLTINIDESIDIECSVNYEFFNYEDLENYEPKINFTFYYKQNHSNYQMIDQIYLNEINDSLIDSNRTFYWQRSIRYRISSINKDEIYREYLCMIVSDSVEKQNFFQDENRICRTSIHFRNNHSSTVTFPQFNPFELSDILIILLIIFSVLLFLISFILCLSARHFHKKRLVQIKPEHKTLANPLNTNQIVSNNNEMKSELPSKFSDTYSSEHKPGCPKYLPPSEYNLLTSSLFTHTTIDNIKKIILPDIPENPDLFNDQTYIHFYIPSKTESISIKNNP